jgi:hypothetical protein
LETNNFARLTKLISSSTKEMPEEICLLFKKYKVEPYKIPCHRISDSPVEYIRACHGDNSLIYDDVEDEFGIGIVSKGVVLKE